MNKWGVGGVLTSKIREYAQILFKARLQFLLTITVFTFILPHLNLFQNLNDKSLVNQVHLKGKQLQHLVGKLLYDYKYGYMRLSIIKGMENPELSSCHSRQTAKICIKILFVNEHLFCFVPFGLLVILQKTCIYVYKGIEVI